jgi:hypothetical protein
VKEQLKKEEKEEGKFCPLEGYMSGALPEMGGECGNEDSHTGMKHSEPKSILPQNYMYVFIQLCYCHMFEIKSRYY